MMAKMFYTLDEAKAALGKSEDEIKQLARDGQLREFRDGSRLMFKADQIEQLKAQMSPADEPIDLEPADSGMGIGLADSRAGSGSMSGISLVDTDARGGIGSGIGSGAGSGLANLGTPSGSGAIGLAGSGLGSGQIGMAGSGMGSGQIGLAGSGMGSGQIGLAGSGLGSGHMGISGSGAIGMNLKDDTALAADLGLSGSVGGMPSPGRSGSGVGSGAASGSGTGLGSATGSRSGIDVFQADEDVDPSAQTAISSNVGEQINLEGVGSGSGLLDLTRESDDTSLGAELLDEIAPNAASGSGTAMRRSPGDTGIGGALVSSEPRSSGGRVLMQVEQADPLAPAFGLAALGAAGVMIFAAFALVTGLVGTHPDIIKKFGSSTTGGFSFLIVLAMALAAPVVLFVIGMIFGKMGT